MRPTKIPQIITRAASIFSKDFNVEGPLVTFDNKLRHGVCSCDAYCVYSLSHVAK